MNQTYIFKNEQQLGPFDDSLILNSLTNRTFDYSDLCSREGWSEWKPLGDIYPQPQKATIKKTPIKNWWCKPFGTLKWGKIIAVLVCFLIILGASLFKYYYVDTGLYWMPSLLVIYLVIRFLWKAITKSVALNKPVPQGPVIIFLIVLAFFTLWGIIYAYNDSKYAKFRELEKKAYAHPYNKAGWIELANEEKRLGMDKCAAISLKQAETAIKDGKLEIKTILYLEKNESMDEYNKSQKRIKEIEKQMGETYQ